MKKNLFKSLSKFTLIFSFLILSPIIAFAQFQGPCQPGTTQGPTGCVPISALGKLISTLQGYINSLIPILIGIGVIYFIWGVVQYVIADGEEAKKIGKDKMIYGIIGFAVIIGLWGLVNILVTTFGLGGVAAPTLEPVAGSGANCSLSGGPKFQDLLCYITGIINNAIIPLLFALATLAFIWGIIQFFILNSDEATKREQGRQFMIWGVIALAVMLSVWGLVNILGSTFHLGGSVLPQVCPPGDSSCR